MSPWRNAARWLDARSDHERLVVLWVLSLIGIALCYLALALVARGSLIL